MKRLLLIAVATACVASVGTLAGQEQARRAQANATELDAVLFVKDLMVPMRDGVRLSTDIYRPTMNGVPVEGKLPVLLQMTPYNKEGTGIAESAQYFAR